MCGKFCLALVVAVIGGMILSIEVDAQSTVDESASCESSTLDEAVNLIREDLKDVKLLREDLKNCLRSNQQQHNTTSCISKEDLKTACSSNQQQFPTVNASSLCEYKARLNIFLVTVRFIHQTIRSLDI